MGFSSLPCVSQTWARAFNLPLLSVLVLNLLILHPLFVVGLEILRYAKCAKYSTHAVTFCRPRRGSGRSPSTPATAGSLCDGLQMLARGQGPGAAAVASSLHSGLATSLDFADILRISHNGDGICPTATVSETGDDPGSGGHGAGTTGAAAEMDRVLGVACPVCPVLVLKGFSDGVFGVIRDCEVGCRPGRIPNARRVGKLSGERAPAVVVGNTADVHGVLLRSALKLFTDFVVGKEVGSCVRNQDYVGSSEYASDRVPQAGRLTRDGASVRPWNSVNNDGERREASVNPTGHHDALEKSPPRGGREMASTADPVRQLVALRFYLQAMCQWPRLAAKLMREIGVWSVLFSEHGMRRGSHVVAHAIDNFGKTPRDAGTAAATATTTQEVYSCDGVDSDSSVGDFAIGWGLVHDATLQLLEAVTLTGLFLSLGTAAAEVIPGQKQRQQQKQSHNGVGVDEPVEMQEYVRFLTRAVSGRRPSAVIAIQGCRWLAHILSTGSSLVHGRAFLPPSLRGAILRLAFQFCRLGDGTESKKGVPGTIAWPLVHASLSLATDIVGTDTADAERGLLFEAAACFATPTLVTPELGKPCIHHRPTASLTSDPSTPDLNATGAWSDLGGSGGSRTPASINSLSPRMPTGSSFGRVSTNPPYPPIPLPEVLFKTALDPRVRRAVFLLTTKLGVQAGRVILMSHGTAVVGGGTVYSEGQRATKRTGESSAGEAWAVRETAAEVLGGLVEGYLCLCERAVEVTVTAGTFSEDYFLLLDALRGACALVRAQGADGASVGDGAGAGGVGRGSPGRTKMGDAGLLPLLQEAFREHHGSFRLLMVLEKVVADPAVSIPAVFTSPSATGDRSDVVRTSLALFTAMMAGNSLGKDAFRRALASHSYRKLASTAAAAAAAVERDTDDARTFPAGKREVARSFAALGDLTRILHATVLSKALMEMLMDGEVPSCILDATEPKYCGDAGGKPGDGGGSRVASKEGDGTVVTPPEIRNPLVVPLIFRLLPDWPTSEQIWVMRAFRVLLRGAGGGVVNRSMCCDVQPALMDQVCVAISYYCIWICCSQGRRWLHLQARALVYCLTLWLLATFKGISNIPD